MKIEGKIVLSQTDLVALLASVLSSKMGLTSSLDFDFNFTQKRKGEAGLETVVDYAGEQDVSVLNDAIAALISEAPVATPAVKKAATKDVDEDELDEEEEEEETPAPKARRGRKPAVKEEAEEDEEEEDDEEEEEEPAPRKGRLAGRRKAAPEPEDDDEEEEEEEEPAPRKRGRPAAKAEPEAPTRRRRLTK